MVAINERFEVIGLYDFAAREEAGAQHTELWVVDTHDPAHPVKGSKVWPEWLGARALDFRVELEGPAGAKRISALVHKASGHRRERRAIEAAIAAAPVVEGVKDIRHIVGGPDRPLVLDEKGATLP